MRTKRAVKILLVQTSNMNLGDTVIADNNCFLLKKAFFPVKCDIFRYSIFSRDVGQIKYVDAVVFAGGIIKVTTEKFWLYIPELLREADRYDVPVFLNGIGVEEFYPSDERSISLKQALNLRCVKGISVRDDIKTLGRDYITNKSVPIVPAIDVAVWTKKTYRQSLSPRKRRPKKQKIGLGIVREKLFADYGTPEIDRQFQLDFWKNIVEELEKRNLSWAIFTNGDTYDELFAGEVLTYIGHGDKLATPQDAASLVENIAGFSGIIAGRMHSNIIAYSLGIPSVGFVWNQKLRFWGERIHHPERFLFPEEMTAQRAVNTLLQAMTEKCKPSISQRRAIYKPLKRFVKQWCRVRSSETEAVLFKDCMVAHALGGIDMRYKNTNSLEAFQYSLDHGYRNFELDIRLTSDQALVCINRWHKDTFKIMNIDANNNDKEMQYPLSLEEFQKCRYYKRFDTTTFEQFIAKASELLEKEGIKVILSVGRPDKKDFEQMIKLIKMYMDKYQVNPRNFMIRLEKKSDVECFRNAKLDMDIIYHMVNPKLEQEETAAECRSVLKYCKIQGINYFSIGPELCSNEICALISEYPVKLCVFTYTHTIKIINAIRNGAVYVGSIYYDVDYLTRLTN